MRCIVSLSSATHVFRENSLQKWVSTLNLSNSQLTSLEVFFKIAYRWCAPLQNRVMKMKDRVVQSTVFSVIMMHT